MIISHRKDKLRLVDQRTIEYYSFTRGGESGKVSLDKLAFEL